MRTRWRFLVSAIILIFCAPLIDANGWLFAWQNRPQTPRAPTSQTRPDERVPSDLTTEIRNLTQEIKELHKSQRQMLDVMLLQIEENRADKLTEKLAAADAQVRALLSQESQLEWRLGHIENELVMRNIVNRQEGESAVRAELQSSYEQVRAERERAEAEQKRLREQVDEVNHRLELVRARLNPEMGGSESTEDANLSIVPKDAGEQTDRPQASPIDRQDDRDRQR